MIVKCTINECINPKLILFDYNNDKENFHNFYNLDETYGEYAVEVNEVYRVFAIAVIDEEVYYLVSDRNNNPQFYPSNIFQIIDGELDYLNLIKEYENEFLKYLISDDFLQDINFLKEILSKKVDSINKFYEYVKL